MKKSFKVENLSSDVYGKKTAVSQNQNLGKKEKTSKIVPKKVGFNHLIANDNSIYRFWFEIKDMFEDATLRRKKLIDDFLIQFGHEISCYRFIRKLINEGFFRETQYAKGRGRDLIMSKKFQKIVVRVENNLAEKKSISGYAKEVGIFESAMGEKTAMDIFSKEMEIVFRKFQEDVGVLKQQIQKTKKSIALESRKAEKDLAVLRRSLR